LMPEVQATFWWLTEGAHRATGVSHRPPRLDTASDLTRIRKSVEEASITAFKARKSRKPKIDHDQYQQLKGEKERLEGTVLEQAAALALLKKKSARVSW